MNLLIRPSTKDDFPATEFITREAFWNLYNPGCVEHLLLHNIRKCDSYVKELDLLAIDGDEIIGHIVSTKAKVVDALSNVHELLCAGPLSVLPKFQKQGIGSKLLNESIAIAKKLGYSGIILFGDPDYYHRFGFKNAKEYNITTKDDQNFEPFMALELAAGGFSSVKGRFFEDTVFEVNPDEVDEFDKQFPHKEKSQAKIEINH